MWVPLIISVTFLTIQLIKRKPLLSPISLFYLLWSFIAFLYILHLQPFLPLSSRTPIVLAFGLFFWRTGAYISELNSSRIRNALRSKKSYELKSNWLYVIALILMWYIQVIVASRSIPYLVMGGTLGEIRYTMRETILGNMTIPFVYFVEPFSLVVIHYNTVRILKKRKVKLALLSTLITLILMELCIGGRFMFYFVALDLLFVYAFSNKVKIRVRTSRINRILIAGSISVLLTAFILVTGVDRVWSTIYIYSCGCISLLDIKLQEFDVIGIHTYGFTSLNGFFRPIATLLRNLTDIPLNNFVALAEKYLLLVEKPVPITTKGDLYNGFVSLFYAFYIDVGIIGVVIGSAIWGYVCERLYQKYKHRGADIDIFLYLLILQAIAISMTRFAFVTYQYALAFVYFVLIFGIQKRLYNENSGHIS